MPFLIKFEEDLVMAQQIKLTDEEVKKVQSAHALVDALTDIYKNSLDDKDTKAKILADLSDAKIAFENAKAEIVEPKINGNYDWSLDYATGTVTLTERHSI